MRFFLLAFALAEVSCSSCKSTPAEHAQAMASVQQQPSQESEAAWLDGRPEPDSAQPIDGGTLVVRVMHEPGGLNPLDDAFHDGWVLRMMSGLVFESLLRADPQDSSLKPQLAERWSANDDHTIATFVLRTDATFSTGQTVTAHDVVAVLNEVADIARPTGATRGELRGLVEFRSLDDRTVEIKWSQPSFHSFRALARLPIFPKSALEGDWTALAQAPVGSGPFTVEQWKRGEALTLKRRPGGHAYLDQIVFRFVKEQPVAGMLFEKGAFDVMTNCAPSLWRSMESKEARAELARRYRRLRTPENSFSYIAWNQSAPQLADVRTRQALAHLYDSQLVATQVDVGLELPTACPFLNGSNSCDPALLPRAFSPALAKGLLADAGYADSDSDGVLDKNGAPLAFTFLAPTNSQRLAKVVPLLQEQCRALGIALTIERVETQTLSARLAARDFEAVSRVWTEFGREHDLFPYFHSSQIDGGSNFVGYRSPRADGLLEAIRAEFDEPRRRALERALTKVLYDEQPYLLMTNRQSLDVAKRRVHGLVPSVAWYDLRAVWVDP